MMDSSERKPTAPWTYDRAFSRNLGLVSPEEQQRLRQCRVAIAGMGGVGGVEALTFARLGVGKFTIADADAFDVVNFNRQAGAMVDTLGCSKAQVMAEQIRAVNPEAEVKIISTFVGPENVDDFLEGADLFVDGVDAFALQARLLLFRKAHQQGIFALTAGPIGMSTCFLAFDPKGLSADDYFGILPTDDDQTQFFKFIIGLSPAALQRHYTDYTYVDLDAHTGPSAGAACHLCAGVIGALAIKALLGRGPMKAAPYAHQFDPYLNRYVVHRQNVVDRLLLKPFKIWLLRRAWARIKAQRKG